MFEPKDPIEHFKQLYEKAKQSEPYDYTAVTFATADEHGRPAARVVLLKDLDERGFVIYTNRESRKGRDLQANPFGALCFYWASIGHQVRVEGPVEPVSDDESDAYFASRVRGSQLGAWASRQSQPLKTRMELIRRYIEVKLRYTGRPVPRPPYWGGYRIIPQRIEFWRSEQYRLHDRMLYTRLEEGWKVQRLFP